MKPCEDCGREKKRAGRYCSNCYMHRYRNDPEKGLERRRKHAQSVVAYQRDNPEKRREWVRQWRYRVTNSKGTIYHRADGRWTAVMDLGKRDGIRKRKHMYGKSRYEVEVKLARAKLMLGTTAEGRLRDQWAGAIMEQAGDQGFANYHLDLDDAFSSERREGMARERRRLRARVAETIGFSPFERQILEVLLKEEYDAEESPR